MLKLYSSQNPADYYTDVECALRADIISQMNTNYVVYDGLAMKYGGAIGIGSDDTHHIIIRNCDFSYIGGSELRNRPGIRYGNGVEFWGNAHDNIVEKCRFWEIYDAAVTNQNLGPVVKQYNIRYRYNLIWNCEYSFEYWNWPEQSQTHHIYFENNTCVNAGYGWGHSQRFNPGGRHLCFYEAAAAAHDIYIRNNIFFEATDNAFFAPKWPETTMAALHMDNNCWYQRVGAMVLLKQRGYTMAQFSAYQSEEGMEANSIIANPLLVDAANGDLHLKKLSLCIDAGTDLGLKADYEGNTIPQGTAPDIGAYEFPNSPVPSVVRKPMGKKYQPQRPVVGEDFQTQDGGN
ncbi:MAG: hypothetical protein JRJ39_10245 [Deltaproteobacteria bacterium]|nr:hypothetical protein [Deltaproteobacteria bacterium]